MQALGGELGGDAASVIDAMATKYTAQPVRTITVLGQHTREHSLIVTLDDSRQHLVDTGSVFTIVTEQEWRRLYELGHASAKLPKSANIRFVSATDTDLGYSHDCVVHLPVCGVRRPIVARICDHFGSGFPFLLGLDTITALGGDISTRRSCVSFLSSEDDDAHEQHYPFARITPNNPVARAASTSASAANDYRRPEQPPARSVPRHKDARKRPSRTTAVVWCTTLALAVWASCSTSAPMLPALDHTFDTPFDPTVELHDAMLDPDLPSPFGAWHPTAVTGVHSTGDTTHTALGTAHYAPDLMDPWLDRASSLTEAYPLVNDSAFHAYSAPVRCHDEEGSTTYHHCFDDREELVKTDIVTTMTTPLT